jgi:NDP-sugar pyrophosphorylase family protein
MGKKRVSVTLSERLVDHIDAETNRSDLNRSQLIEQILDNYMDELRIKTAVVFCGGPEAKVMNSYKGEPVLKHVLEDLNNYVSRVILLAGLNSEEIEEEFGSQYKDMALEYVSDETMGTAAALSRVENRIGGTFLAVNGHVISDVDIKEMTETHREEGRTATMALTTVENPTSYGVAKLKGRKIRGFEEKPQPGQEPSRLINAGTYILEPEIFNHLKEDSIETVFEQLAKEGKLSGYIYGGKWKDITQE